MAEKRIEARKKGCTQNK